MGLALELREEAAAVQREMAAAEGSAGALLGAMAVAVARVRAVVRRVRRRVAVGATLMVGELSVTVEVGLALALQEGAAAEGSAGDLGGAMAVAVARVACTVGVRWTLAAAPVPVEAASTEAVSTEAVPTEAGSREGWW